MQIKILTRYVILFMLILFSNVALAQVNKETKQNLKPTTYILPDGKIFNILKFDSLSGVWGKDRVMFVHNEDDDEKGIIHLVRISDEMKNKMEDKKKLNDQVMTSMLNKNAPDFELSDLQGERWSLKKFKGKVIILNFWFTTCIPCIKEIPELNKLVDEYDPKNVVFLGLTFNNSDQVRKFLTKHPFKYTLFPASKEVDKKYNISSWPASIVIDRDGKIKKIIYSSDKIHDELKNEINPLL